MVLPVTHNNMSCRIPYDRLQKLFDKSLQYDRSTYRYYRNSIDSIMKLAIADEAKVHAIWFMGLAYNNALELDVDIITEGLPLKINDLVVDRLTNISTDYSELLDKVLNVVNPKTLTEDPDLDPDPVAKEVKIKSTIESLNEVLLKVNKSSAKELASLYDDFKSIIEKDRTLSNPTIQVHLGKFKEALAKKRISSLITSLNATIDLEIKDLEPNLIEETLIDVAGDEFENNVYIVTQPNGSLIEVLYKNGEYYVIPQTGPITEESLTLYSVQELDHVSKFYPEKLNESESDSTGSEFRLNKDKLSGLAFENIRIYETPTEQNPTRDTRPGNKKISDGLKVGEGLGKQIRLIADKRRPRLNKARLLRLQKAGKDITFENSLRPHQIKYLSNHPDKPLLSILHPINGVMLRISDRAGLNWDSIFSLDNLGFVYADGTTRFVDWNNEEDLKLLQQILKIQVYDKYDSTKQIQSYQWLEPTPSQIVQLREGVNAIKILKDEALSSMEEDQDEIDIDPDLFNQFISINNVFSKFNFNESGQVHQTLESLKDQLLPTSSVILTSVADVIGGEVVTSSIRDEYVIGIIKRDGTGVYFESSLKPGVRPVDSDNNIITEEELFRNNGVNIEHLVTVANRPNLSSYSFFYLVKKVNVWDLRPMRKLAPISTKRDVVNFISALGGMLDNKPAFSPDNAGDLAIMINDFNNKGWGFNAFKGIASNIEFLRMWNNEPVFGIKFRALKGYRYEEEFNSKNLKIEFEFDYDQLAVWLNKLYKELDINPSDYKTIEQRLELGNILSSKLEKNKEVLSEDIKIYIDKIVDSYNSTVNKVFADAKLIVDAHNKDVTSGKAPYLIEDTLIPYALFSNINGPVSSFKLRSGVKSENPLANYNVFENKLDTISENRLTITLAKPRVRTGDTLKTILPDIAKQPAKIRSRIKVSTPEKTVEIIKQDDAPVEPIVNTPVAPSFRRSVPSSKKNFNNRANSLAQSLKNIKLISSKELAEEISDVERMLGTTTSVVGEDLNGEDVDGVVLGYFENNVIRLNNTLKVAGIAYHEAFHAVFRTGFTNEDRDAYLKAVKIILGEPIPDKDGRLYLTVRGETIYLDEFKKHRRFEDVSDSVITDYIYEEYLADGFKDFKLNKKKSTSTLINILYKAIDSLIRIFRNPAYKRAKEKINALYVDIDNQKYLNVKGDPYNTGTKAYELASIPTAINQTATGLAYEVVQIDNNTNDQLVDRITYEVLKRSGDIRKDDFESFRVVYDEVTVDLINELRIESFIPADHPNPQVVIDHYGPLHRAMRFMMGAAHRDGINEVFMLDNKSNDPEYDNFRFDELEDAMSLSEGAYKELREQVYKQFESIGLIEELDSDEYDNEDFGSRDEDQVGERFDDQSLLTFKPYDGSKSFQKLIRFIKYTYDDTRLNVSFPKMVSSKNVINTIRKITANNPKDTLMNALGRHLDYLENIINEYYEYEQDPKNSLGYTPLDMHNTIDQYNTVLAVYNTMMEQADLDERFMPRRSAGIPFFNMFHDVFYYAQKDVNVIEILTNDENVDDDFENDTKGRPVRNRYKASDLVQKHEIGRLLHSFETDVRLGLESISKNNLNTLRADLGSFNKDQVPKTSAEFKNIINQIYRLTSIGKLNIPRNLIEFSVAAYVKNKEKNSPITRDLKTRINNIIDINKKFYNDGSYLDIPIFMGYYKDVISNRGQKESALDSSIQNLKSEYQYSIPFQIKYDPSLGGMTVLNQEGKPISQYVSYVPSIQIVSDIKEKGLEEALRLHYKEFYSWFENNQFIAPALNDSTKNVTNDRIRVFFENLDISINGGLYQSFNGVRHKSTFKGLGDKGYTLGVLGMFANRKAIRGNYNQPVVMFTRPITQLEATSTQLNVTSLYLDYNNQSTGPLAIKKQFKNIIRQEYIRIASEWATRNDFKRRYEGYNASTNSIGDVITDDTGLSDNKKLRAYKFNIIADFFDANETTSDLKDFLISSAKDGLSFETAMSQLEFSEEDPSKLLSVESVIDSQILMYAESNVEDFKNYLKSIDISYDDIPSNINIDSSLELRKELGANDRGNIQLTEYRREDDPNSDTSKYVRIEDKTNKNKDAFIRDFVYNYWFNSMNVNQLFDGDIAISIKNFVAYFKRQKSGVAAGNNYRNIGIPELEDVTVTASIKEFKGYLGAESTDPVTTRDNTSDPVVIADGQAWTSIDRRIKKYKSGGLLPDNLLNIIKKLRYSKLSHDEIKELRDNDIILNSDKPVVAHPLFYYKDSEHYINRADVSTIINPDMVAALYEELDSINFSDNSYDEDPYATYQSIVRQIHENFAPKKGRAFLHHMLNAIEYHKVDVVFDESVSKKATVAPLVITPYLLEENYTISQPVMKHGDVHIESFKDGYINLEYSRSEISNLLVYDQVKTGHLSSEVTDAIQKKLLIPAQLDPVEFPHVKQIADLQNEIVNSRLKFLQQVFKTTDPSTIITKAVQRGIISEGGGENLLKYYSLDQDGKNLFNMNLPVLGKTPMFYFFSLYNNNVFSPKIAGKKFYHVSNLGYKIVVDNNDNPISREELDNNPLEYEFNDTRYPTVKKSTDKAGVVTYTVEVIIPRELAKTSEERKFFEKLYSEFLGARIPTEDKRSIVVAKVVDYIDETYGNSIIVPSQVHKWAGSDLDIDSLYAETLDYYKNKMGDLVQYGDYSVYTSKYGMTQSEAVFIEYLHFIGDDPSFKGFIEADMKRQQNSFAYSWQSSRESSRSFSKGVSDYFNSDDLPTGISKEDRDTVMMLTKLQAVINVLKENNLPSTKEELYNFRVLEGNPVTPVLQNEILFYKKALISDERVYTKYTEKASAEGYIESYNKDKAIIENTIQGKPLNKSNPFLFQTVARVRSLNSGAKGSLGANASQNKGMTLIASSKIKLTPEYTFNFKYNDKKIKTNTPAENSVQLVGGAIGMSADDPSHQTLGPLNISVTNSAIMNALYAYGYPQQFARLIHSVDAISQTVTRFNLGTDPSYSKTGHFKIGFGKFILNELNPMISLDENKKELVKKGVVKASKDIKGAYDIDLTKVTIEFKDIPVSTRLNTKTPTDFNITIRNLKGEILSDKLASIVLLAFYEKMYQIGSAISFKFSKVTDVHKALKPSFSTLSKVKNAYKFIKDNDMFVDAGRIFKANPGLNLLLNDGIEDMLDKSKQVFLDETSVFKGIASLFQYGMNEPDQVSAELKSILGLSALHTYMKSKINDIDREDPNFEELFLLALNDTMNVEYWSENKIQGDLEILKNKFPNNEFLGSLSMKPASFNGKGTTRVVNSIIGSKVNVESQDKMMNDFYQLFYHNDPSVRNMIVRVAVHGIVRDGASSRSGGYLKIVAPELFSLLSDRFDTIQKRFYDIDSSKKPKKESYMKSLDSAFQDIYGLDKKKKESTGHISKVSIQSILTKMISVMSMQEGGNPMIRMSFFEGNDKINPGKFADIPLGTFAKIVNNILPNNKNEIYKLGERGAIIPASTKKSLTPPQKSSKTKFDFWRENNDNVVFFDLNEIIEKESTDRLLKAQGIISLPNGNYSFPLYKINNFEGGELFILDELDGKPFTDSLFEKMFLAYKNIAEPDALLEGKSARYKKVSKQGLDRIIPNAFTNKIGVEIKGLTNKRIEGQEVVYDAPDLESHVKVVGKSVVVQLRDYIANIKEKKFFHDKNVILIGSVFTKYSSNSTGKLFINGVETSDNQKNEYANKLGFPNYSEMIKDPKMHAWLNPGKRNGQTVVNSMYVGSYVIEDSDLNNTETMKINVIPLDKANRFTRESVKNDPDYLYLFTDNAGRSSGPNPVLSTSNYAKEHGTGKKYPGTTQAVIRGLDNALPITTMVDDKQTQWNDSQFNVYKKIIDKEISNILKLSKFYKGIKYSGESQFGEGRYSKIKESAPKIWNYLNQKLKEIGINNNPLSVDDSIDSSIIKSAVRESDESSDPFCDN